MPAPAIIHSLTTLELCRPPQRLTNAPGTRGSRHIIENVQESLPNCEVHNCRVNIAIAGNKVHRCVTNRHKAMAAHEVVVPGVIDYFRSVLREVTEFIE